MPLAEIFCLIKDVASTIKSVVCAYREHNRHSRLKFLSLNSNIREGDPQSIVTAMIDISYEKQKKALQQAGSSAGKLLFDQIAVATAFTPGAALNIVAKVSKIFLTIYSIIERVVQSISIEKQLSLIFNAARNSYDEFMSNT